MTIEYNYLVLEINWIEGACRNLVYFIEPRVATQTKRGGKKKKIKGGKEKLTNNYHTMPPSLKKEVELIFPSFESVCDSFDRI